MKSCDFHKVLYLPCIDMELLLQAVLPIHRFLSITLQVRLQLLPAYPKRLQPLRQANFLLPLPKDLRLQLGNLVGHLHRGSTRLLLTCRNGRAAAPSPRRPRS
jgi:hypothetical protein